MFVMALETLRCMQEKVLMSARDANIGSVFGIGFPTWTGGTVQYVNQYGLTAFIQRANQLTERYGDRFMPPENLTDAAKKGEKL